MALPPDIPDELVELIARRLRVIGEPMRIKLLSQLRDGERSVNELAAATGSSQQNVSKHLGVLLDARIVGRRKAANQALYRIQDESVFRLCDEVCGTIQRQHAELATIITEVNA